MKIVFELDLEEGRDLPTKTLLDAWRTLNLHSDTRSVLGGKYQLVQLLLNELGHHWCWRDPIPRVDEASMFLRGVEKAVLELESKLLKDPGIMDEEPHLPYFGKR